MNRTEVLKLIYPAPEGFRGRRFTQNTPILPDVWIAYGTAPPSATPRSMMVQQLLLTPHAKSSVQQLVNELRGRTGGEAFIAYNESHVLAELTFGQLIRAVLPLSSWWQRNVEAKDERGVRLLDRIAEALSELAGARDIADLLLDPARLLEVPGAQKQVSSDVLDMIRITGGILLDQTVPEADREGALREMVRAARDLLVTDGVPPARTERGVPPVWSVSCNRTAETAITTSRLAIKADAAIRLFEISCKEVVWAVIDSGVDSNHPAFTNWPGTDTSGAGEDSDEPPTRVIESYDFTLLMPLQRYTLRPTDPAIPQRLRDRFDALRNQGVAVDEIVDGLKERLRTGWPLEWGQLKPLLRIEKDSDEITPASPHGTHVAGILAADWRKLGADDKPPRSAARRYVGPPDESLIGVCPDIRLYDLRVIGAEGGNEFAILAALQFVRYLNTNRDKMVIHGVNLSFSLQHNVKSFACGSTPVCMECERLVNSGVVVVAAAGNRGYTQDVDLFESYRAMTITDPGNADEVITVGSTHRMEPHRYGVSYFSSRGPTGDGRLKPDLVAPGEKITSVVPGNSVTELDGTSMAAPHVSGAAALLMARHQELIGRPRQVKEILCKTATDLGRDRNFQGAGMLDVLRAIQSV
jgi:hypothetical protein